MEAGTKDKKYKKAGNGRHLRGRDRGILILEDVALTATLAWVFYDSIYGMAVFPFVAVLNHFRYLRQNEEKWQQAFSTEYKEFLQALTSSLQIGYSVERAFEECEITIRSLFGEESILQSDLHELNQKVRMRTPVEKAFIEMSDIYCQEDMTGFAEVFRFAKRLGGNYVENVRRCAAKIEDKLELQTEIGMAVAEKKFELKVMMAMPMGILAYMKVSSPDFMAGIYHNLFGICMMSVCIGVYAGSIFLGRKITDIRV